MAIDGLPPAPQRGTDPPPAFVVKADNHVASLDNFVDQVNAEIVIINANTAAAAASQVAAAQSETNAAESEAAAQSAANFKGNWADLTGVLNVPASVFHVGTFWQLLVNLADVTLSEPGITTDWAKIDQSEQITHNTILHFYRNR